MKQINKYQSESVFFVAYMNPVIVLTVNLATYS